MVSKHSLVKHFHEGVAHYWVEPMEDRVLPRLRRGNPGVARRALFQLGFFYSNVGRVLVQNLRLVVERWKGPDWTISYVGSGYSAEALRFSLFEEEPEVEVLPRAFLWQSPKRVQALQGSSDLVITEMNRIVRLPGMKKGYLFSGPRWVKQVLYDIQRPMDDILAEMNQTMRRRIRKLESQGYCYELTTSDEDFERFYHQMYLPYITDRHAGHGAILEKPEAIHRVFKSGSLLLVKRDEEWINGMLCNIEDGVCNARQMGVMNADFELVKQGANVALWWFMLLWAREQGATSFDFGASRPQTGNGVFNFKRQWGTRVTTDMGQPEILSFYSQKIPPALREHLNQRGIVSQVGNRYYQVVFPEPGMPIDESALCDSVKDADTYGLDGQYLVVPGGEKRVAERAEGITKEHLATERLGDGVQRASD